MSVVSLALIAAGIVLIAVGYRRARGPWLRYQALKEQDENVSRYEAWRGGPRDGGRSGASVAMELLRRQARVGATIALLGFVLVLAGYLLH